MVDCLVSELSHQESSINSTLQKVPLDFSRFSHLKTISINNLMYSFDSYNLLLSLPMLQLERIKLSCVYLKKKEWTELLNNWTAMLEEQKEMDKFTFFNSLKEFDFDIIERINENSLSQLVKFLFSFPHLENISLETAYRLWNISLPPLPPNIK